MTYWIRIFAVAALLFCGAGSAVAQQEQFDTDKIQDLPGFGEELSADDFAAQSDVYQEKPLGDPHLAFSVNLPKGWTKSDSAAHLSYKDKEIGKAGINQRILGEVAKFYGPGRIEGQSRFDLYSQSLDYDVSAKNWFLQEALLRGFTLEGLRELSEKRIEVLYVTIDRDVSYIVRAVIEINGPRVIVGSYMVPEMFWKEERGFQQRAIESFYFLNPEKSNIELTRTYAFLDLLSFSYPVSWRLIAPSIFSIDGMDAKLVYSVNERTLGGEINLSIISTSLEGAVDDEIRYLKQEAESRGVQIGELIETKSDYDRPRHVFYNHTERYRAIDSDNKIAEHEYWVSVMEEERYFYIVTMLTPSRRSEFYTWARNSEAFETVVEGFKR